MSTWKEPANLIHRGSSLASSVRVELEEEKVRQMRRVFANGPFRHRLRRTYRNRRTGAGCPAHVRRFVGLNE